MPKLLATLVLCMLPALLQAQPGGNGFQGLAAEMTEEERAAAGIDDLSPAQRQYLDAWLRDRFAAEPEVADPATVQPGAAVMAAEQASEADLAARENAIEAEVERRVAEELAAVQAAEVAEEATANEPFEATITGGFSGWSGKTVFALDNGQVWRQRTGSSRYRHTRGGNEVRFKRSFLGLWTMTVVSTGRSVGVRRID